MKVTVVIPNYNGMKYIKLCLDSILNQTYRDYSVLVIDNASTDGSDKFIEDNYDNVELVRMKKNYGFSTAVNKGIELSDSEYVLLLNNDTQTEPDFIAELVKEIEKSEDIFAVSGKMINFAKRDIMDDAGDCYTLMGWGYQRGLGKKIDNYDKSMEVFSACAGAAIYRKSVFEKIGMFDENHFAYMEDIDICYRARIFGYKNRYCADAIVYHVGSGTSGSRHNKFKVRLAARNNIYIIYKNMPFLQFMVNFPFIVAGIITKYIYFRKLDMGKSYREGFFEGLKTCYKLKKVEYDPSNKKNYFDIEKEILKGTAIFVKEKIEK